MHAEVEVTGGARQVGYCCALLNISELSACRNCTLASAWFLLRIA